MTKDWYVLLGAQEARLAYLQEQVTKLESRVDALIRDLRKVAEYV